MPLIDELRAHFRASTQPRLAEMRQQLDALHRDAADAEALDGIARHFHALAGLGATYGFPRVSELADQAEAVAMPLARTKAAPTTEQLRRWTVLLAEIGRDLG